MDAIELILSDARGQYVPRDFGLMLWNELDLDLDVSKSLPEWSGITVDEIHLLTCYQREGFEEETEQYWHVWNSLLDRARYTRDGHTWSLWQDGDLFLICDELLSDEEYREFFGESRS